MCPLSSVAVSVWEICFTTHLSISELRKSFIFYCKKRQIYLAHIFKSPTFASAFENESGDRLTFWQKRSKNPYFFLFLRGCFFRNFLLRKEKWKKTSDLFGRYEIKFLPLHPLSKRKQALIEILFTRRAVTTFLYFFVLPFARETTGKRKRKKLPEIFGRYT